MRWIAAAALAACTTPTWHRAPTLGVEIDAPADARVQESPGHVFVGDATFELNLFEVGELSPATAADQQALLERMPGFAAVTAQHVDGDTWRFDYALAGGKAGTISRIRAGRTYDCGVHGVTPAIASAVGDACARVKAP